jgi:competence ComEA-like helix-hairpin-helix protein
MFRGYGKREFMAWTAISCFVAFGLAAILVKRVRPVGPMEFRELPGTVQSSPTKPPPFSPRVQPEMDRAAAEEQVSRRTPVASSGEPVEDAAPPQDPKPTKEHGKAKAEPEAESISVNEGDLAELEKLPGVGATIAQRIVDYRTEHGPFQSVDELRNVKGIGEKRFAKIEPYLKL